MCILGILSLSERLFFTGFHWKSVKLQVCGEKVGHRKTDYLPLQRVFLSLTASLSLPGSVPPVKHIFFDVKQITVPTRLTHTHCAALCVSG